MGFTAENVVFPVDNWDDLAVINYTSGTTSAPKGVMLTYKALSANVDFGQRYIPSSSEYTMVSMLPMAHMYGLMFEFLYPLCNGTSITFLGKTPSPTLLLAAMKEVRPDRLNTGPRVREKIDKSARLPALSNCWRQVPDFKAGKGDFAERARRKSADDYHGRGTAQS